MRTKVAAAIALLVSATVYAFLAPPTNPEDWTAPDLARTLFFHLPSAFMASGLIIFSAILGARYLKSNNLAFDHRLGAAIELGTLFAVVTMLTGIFFSRVQWGAWWQNDPRQTSFLIVLLLFIAGLVIRGAIDDDRKRASASAVYAVAAVIPSLFLIFVFPRLPQVRAASFHPSQTVQQNLLSGEYRLGVLWMLAALIVTTAVLYRMRVESTEKSSYVSSVPANDEDGPTTERIEMEEN